MQSIVPQKGWGKLLEHLTEKEEYEKKFIDTAGHDIHRCPLGRRF